MSFIKAMGSGNFTTTENGALTNESTMSKLLDWFYHGGALRNRPQGAIQLFQDAFDEDPEQALRILFYLRDVRGGQGERKVFRTVMQWIASSNSTNAVAIKDWLVQGNLHFIPQYGRWDDLLAMTEEGDRSFDQCVVTYIRTVLNQDWENMKQGKFTSMCAKWMPSENTSSHDTRAKARWLIQKLDTTPKHYRRKLSKLRAYLKIVETNLSQKDYSFDYSQVPSNASLKYRKAFKRNDEERYTAYLESVKKGEKKINAATLYPYDLIHKVWTEPRNAAVEALWANLPDYVDNLQGLVVADTSASMEGRPMEVSISLAMYIAERNKSEVFKDYFISFSEQPKFHKIKGNTLWDRMNSVKLGDVANTNLEAVFQMILARAKEYRVPQEDMPKILLIVSDMEFDHCTTTNNGTHFTNYEVIKQNYHEFGYEIPTLVFWNVNSRNTQAPVTIHDSGALLISGCNPVVLKYALGGTYDPMEMLYNVTNSTRYSNIHYPNNLIDGD